MIRFFPLLVLLACGDKGDTGEDAVMVEVSGTFRVKDFHEPIFDVIVCADGDGDCLITETDGVFSWSFPASSEVWLSATHSDFADIVLPLRTGTGDSDPIDVVLWPIEQWELMLQAGGANWDPGTGALLLTMRQNPSPPGIGSPDPGVADAQVDVAFEGARSRYFEDGGDYLDGVLSRSTNSGMVAVFDAPPGEHDVAVRPDSGICAPRELGWSKSAPFQADRVTLAVFACTPE